MEGAIGPVAGALGSAASRPVLRAFTERAKSATPCAALCCVLTALRKVCGVPQITPTPAQWNAIELYCSFPWMKAQESRFETVPHRSVPVLSRGAMIRKGEAGVARFKFRLTTWLVALAVAPDPRSW